MQPINGCQAALTSKIDSLQIEMGLMRKDSEKLRRRVDEVETHVGDTEEVVRDHMATLHTLQIRLKHLEAKTEDAENRNWRNNLRIIGLPEGTEGPDTPAFTEHLLHTFFPQAPFS